MSFENITIGSWVKIVDRSIFTRGIEVGDLAEVRNKLHGELTIKLLSGDAKDIVQFVASERRVELVWLAPEEEAP